MTNTIFFIIFIPILSIILLLINFVLAPHNPYQEKDSPFECGYHSFVGQNRTEFSVSFFIFALLFLLFDLEILLVYPYSVSGYNNDIYGLIIVMVFFILLTLGFIFELGKNALTIDSKQTLQTIIVSEPSKVSEPSIFLIKKNLKVSSFFSSFFVKIIRDILNRIGKSITILRVFFVYHFLNRMTNKIITNETILNRIYKRILYLLFDIILYILLNTFTNGTILNLI